MPADLRRARLLRRHAHPARHRRHRAHDRHGGGRQRARLRAHQGGAAGRPHGAVGASTPASSNALSSIIDANVTTLIAALFLFQFGTGPMRGFAVTLSIGILGTIFTARLRQPLAVRPHALPQPAGRVDLDLTGGRTRGESHGHPAQHQHRLHEVPQVLDLASRSPWSSAASRSSPGQLNIGIDFAGGTQLTCSSRPPTSRPAHPARAPAGGADPALRQRATTRSRPHAARDGPRRGAPGRAALDRELNPADGKPTSTRSAPTGSPAAHPPTRRLPARRRRALQRSPRSCEAQEQRPVRVLGQSRPMDFARQCRGAEQRARLASGLGSRTSVRRSAIGAAPQGLYAVLGRCSACWSTSGSASSSASASAPSWRRIHDVLVTLGLFALFGYEFNLTTIAAFLTLIGYSVNDTVVIFDRVRENMRKTAPRAADPGDEREHQPDAVAHHPDRRHRRCSPRRAVRARRRRDPRLRLRASSSASSSAPTRRSTSPARSRCSGSSASAARRPSKAGGAPVKPQPGRRRTASAPPARAARRFVGARPPRAPGNRGPSIFDPVE